ncbi:GGDEF domain-containing protein [Cellvibrio japonicus]|uniref:diguanylate cyclase n=1 Tax=Cellvibrio japonicus (strain Ueda107) TaxID=498211 RepID=B3PBW6_CELJU|nr:GGDEF domain-containing protein [Cellvibrio japonicus]ACE86164.1 GGDEF domain protein [Cellvibrio japonicus Ueda107]QEI11782.1 GGDEF domain-containing protein [Cellvibrio japonicus]QEI15356.1 GGDEF domain-containing protein [Cellvibrio japonicus]QEI18935.1 GGDEF domain-containing protein [Cellvibrio japonicus]
MLDERTLKFELGLVKFFGLLSLVGISPFAVMRYLQGEYLHALLDVGIVSVALLNAWVAHHQRRVAQSNLTIAASLYTAGAVVVAYLNSPLFVFWVFPAIFANVFLLRALNALIANLLAISALVPLALRLPNMVDAMAMIASLLFSTSLAYVFALQTERQRALLEKSASQDPLTELANRRALNQTLKQCLDDFQRNQTPATLIIFDLDYFKQINDKFGHSIGDEILQNLAQLITRRIRTTDRAFRFGGEEFIVLARNTQLEEARLFAEQLRVNISLELNAPEGEITASFGCAELKPNETLDGWFNRADKAVYQAKQLGRNRVVCAH